MRPATPTAGVLALLRPEVDQKIFAPKTHEPSPGTDALAGYTETTCGFRLEQHRLQTGIVPHTRGAMEFNFPRAINALISTPRVPLSRIAAAFSRDPHTITRARMQGEHARRPPAGWEPVLA